jgi:hypothetical protein
MSFDEFFLPVSQRVEMNYIFSDNIRILYLSWYVLCLSDLYRKLTDHFRPKLFDDSETVN